MEINCQLARLIINILLVCLLSGCGGAYDVKMAPGVPLDRSKIALIKPGSTTLSNILAWFGPPYYIIDGSREMLETIPPPHMVGHVPSSYNSFFRTRILTAPENSVILVYIDMYGELFHAVAAAPAAADLYKERFWSEELFVYVSKQDRIVLEVSGSLRQE